METQTKDTFSEKNLFIKMVISAWESQNKKVNELLETLSDEQLLKETAPGRNTGFYLLGHLTAVNDGILPLLGFGDKLYPQLENVFLRQPEGSGLETPSLSDLKTYWHTVNDALTQHIHKVQPNDWFTRHNAVSQEDFIREPHRNKLNILINRANHQSYHVGQLVYLKKK